MKTLLAISLTVAALTIGTAPVAPISSTAIAGGIVTNKWWCGAAACAHRIPKSEERIVGGKPQ
jgi:hypothetical protein